MSESHSGVRIRDIVELVFAEREPAGATAYVDSKSPVWRSFKVLAQVIADSECFRKHQHVRIVWSVGKARLAAVPWLAFLDDRITDSVRRGEFGALLFAEDLNSVHVVYMLGTTAAIERHGRRTGRTVLAEASQRLASELTQLSAAGFAPGPADSIATTSSLGKDYESGVVAHKIYRRGEVPDDAVILDDLDMVLTALETRALGKSTSDTPGASRSCGTVSTGSEREALGEPSVRCDKDEAVRLRAERLRYLLVYCKDPPRLQNVYRPVLVYLLAEKRGLATAHDLAASFAEAMQMPLLSARSKALGDPVRVLRNHGITEDRDGRIRLLAEPLGEADSGQVKQICRATLQRFATGKVLESWQRRILGRCGVNVSTDDGLQSTSSEQQPLRDAPRAAIHTRGSRGSVAATCPICSAIKRSAVIAELPTAVVLRDDDENGENLVVAPRRHVADPFQMGDDELRDVFDLLRMMRDHLASAGQTRADLVLNIDVSEHGNEPEHHAVFRLRRAREPGA